MVQFLYTTRDNFLSRVGNISQVVYRNCTINSPAFKRVWLARLLWRYLVSANRRYELIRKQLSSVRTAIRKSAYEMDFAHALTGGHGTVEKGGSIRGGGPPALDSDSACVQYFQ